MECAKTNNDHFIDCCHETYQYIYSSLSLVEIKMILIRQLKDFVIDNDTLKDINNGCKKYCPVPMLAVIKQFHFHEPTTLTRRRGCIDSPGSLTTNVNQGRLLEHVSQSPKRILRRTSFTKMHTGLQGSKENRIFLFDVWIR